MKTKAFITALAFMLAGPALQAQDATQIVKRAYEKQKGENSISTMQMQVVRPSWQRTISFKSWQKGYDLALTLITAPAAEKGQTFLKRENEMWNYQPSINRMIKLPPSMMSQGWMGSDFSNNELLNQSSIVDEYTHKIIGNETIQGRDCWKIEMSPKPDADLIWGKIVAWITKEGDHQLQTKYYDEDGYLVKTETASNIKTMDGRQIPTHFEIIPADEEGNKTILDIMSIDYGVQFEDRFFSQQNMKRVRE